MQNKYVIYTCLTGGYDQLQQPQAVNPEYDYICFTDDFPQGRMGVWTIVPLPFKHKDKLVASRYVKLLPHTVLSSYSCSVWMDANITITGDLFYEYVHRCINDEKVLIAQVNHVYQNRDCIYDEIEACLEAGKIGLWAALGQFFYLRRNHFPRHQGLFENNLIFRRHNDSFVKLISEVWWKEFNRHAKRDQLSLNYIYWKEYYTPAQLLAPGECARNVDYLKYVNHAGQPQVKGLRGKIRIKVSIPFSCMVYRLLTKPYRSK